MFAGAPWANTQKLAAANGVLNYFTGITRSVFCLLQFYLLFTLGSSGNAGRSFIADLQQADSSNLLSAFTGGIVFNIANILLVAAAIAIAGMAVAFPVGIGIALVLGVVLNYIAQPEGNVLLLFAGVALIAAAIIINAVAYKKHQRTISQHLQRACYFCCERFANGPVLQVCCKCYVQ